RRVAHPSGVAGGDAGPPRLRCCSLGGEPVSHSPPRAATFGTARGAWPVRGTKDMQRRHSVIAFSVLPFAALQSEPRDQDGGEQERNHGGSDGRALAEIAAADGALGAERRHQMRGGGGAPAREHPDERGIGGGGE